MVTVRDGTSSPPSPLPACGRRCRRRHDHAHARTHARTHCPGSALIHTRTHAHTHARTPARTHARTHAFHVRRVRSRTFRDRRSRCRTQKTGRGTACRSRGRPCHIMRCHQVCHSMSHKVKGVAVLFVDHEDDPVASCDAMQCVIQGHRSRYCNASHAMPCHVMPCHVMPYHVMVTAAPAASA